MDQLSIFILTKNRPCELSRALEYYSGSGTKLFVLDGSSEEYCTETISACATFEEVDHHILPKSSILSRLQLAASLCKTEYMALAPDDDFLIHSSLSMGIKALGMDKNKTHKLAYGDHCGFAISGSQPIFTPLWIWSAYFNINDSKTEMQRIYRAFCHVQTARFFWTLYRSDFFIRLLKIATSLKKSIYSYECFFAIACIALGNPKYIEVPILVRNTLNEPVEKGGQRSKEQREAWASDKKSVIELTVNGIAPHLINAGFTKDNIMSLLETLIAAETAPLPAKINEKIFPEFACHELFGSDNPYGIRKDCRETGKLIEGYDADVHKLKRAIKQR